MQYLNAFKDEGDDAKEHKDRSYILRGSGECVVECLFSLNFANHNSPWLLLFMILKKKNSLFTIKNNCYIYFLFYPSIISIYLHIFNLIFD